MSQASTGGVPLPSKTASLDQQGVRKLLAEARNNRAVADEAADRLEADPKALIGQLFRLSSTQQQAIQNTPDADLRARMAPLVARLRAGNYEPDKVSFDPGTPPDLHGHCNCGFTF
jgi:hypothetical protein